MLDRPPPEAPRQAIAACVGAHTGPNIKQITVPGAAQLAVLRYGVLKRSEPVRANFAVGDERSVAELEYAARLSVELDKKRQPRAQFAQGAEGEWSR